MLAEPQFASVEARVRLLRSMPDLAGVDVDTLLLMAEGSRFRRFRPGQVVWRETEPVTDVLYVLEGRVRVERGGAVVSRVESRHALGYTALLTGSAYVGATAEILTVALEIPGDAVRIALQRDFGLQRLVLRGLARALIAERGPLPELEDAPAKGSWRDEELSLVERVVALRRSPLLSANVDGLAEIASAAKEIRLQKGEPVWIEGDPATFWIRVESGLLECSTEREEGGRAVVVGAAADVGHLDALAETPRTHTARAVSGVIALRIDLIEWFAVLELHTRVATDLTTLLASTLRNE